MQFQSLNPPPHDARSINWGSVVLPLGTPGGGVHKGVPRRPCILVWTHGHSLGAVPQPRLCPHQVFIAGISGEVQMSVCSPSSSWDSSDLKGHFSMKVWVSQIEAASACSYGVGQRTGNNYRLHMGRYNGLQSICHSYKRTKCRNQASVRGCTQSYY